jgi:serine/threonine-protein kinase
VPTSVLLAGRYRLLDPLARGGAGTVWRATDETLGRQVAVKVVDVSASPEPVATARFERELHATARLAHPNVVTVYDGGFEADRAYLVMELLAGPSLAELVSARGPLPVDEALDYAAQVCAGLAAAHDASVVHRDLKPSNLVLNEGGIVKLVDLGIARLLAAPDSATLTDLTSTGTVLGTAAYIAPEQASGGWVDGRTDLYALGCVLFFLLSGAPPYEADSPVAVAAQHLHAPVPSLRDRRPDLPIALDGLVRDLLAKDPDRRPQRAQDALARIRAVPTPGDETPATLRLDADDRGKPIPAPATFLGDTGSALQDQTETIPTANSVHAVTDTTAAPGDPHHDHRRRIVAAAVLVTLFVGALAFALVDRGAGPRRAAAAPPKPTASTSTSEPTTTQTTAPPTTPAPPTPAQAAADLAAAVAQASASGDLQPGPAADLARQVADLQRAIPDGKPGQVGHMVADLAHHLDDLVNGGQPTSAGRAMFDAPLAALEQAYPSSQAGGDQQGNGD